MRWEVVVKCGRGVDLSDDVVFLLSIFFLLAASSKTHSER